MASVPLNYRSYMIVLIYTENIMHMSYKLMRNMAGAMILFVSISKRTAMNAGNVNNTLNFTNA